MHESIARMSLDEFLTLMTVLVFTEDEVAEKIASYTPASAAERIRIAQAVLEMRTLRGGLPVTGPVRTALRQIAGLGPLPGDGPVPQT